MFALSLATAAAADTANTVFAASYGSHMVLQQAPQQAVLWGFTGTAEGDIEIGLTSVDGVITVTATVHPYNATANRWRAILPARYASNDTLKSPPAPISHTISLTKGGVLGAKLEDVLFGDLWVCSGQVSRPAAFAGQYSLTPPPHAASTAR